jgi:hypothetical protein
MGGAVALIALHLLRHYNNSERMFRLFDSFQDPHEPLPIDGSLVLGLLGGIENAKGRLLPVTGFYSKVTHGIGPGDPKKVNQLLTEFVRYKAEKIKIYEGWFQHTIEPASAEINQIALLMLDCGLYAPNQICMEHLYQKVVPGGMIVVDDYHSCDGCKTAIGEYLDKNKIKVSICTVPTTAMIYWTKE